jgi:hypothetical protein
MSSTLLPADRCSSSSSSRMMMSEPLLVHPSDETRKPPTSTSRHLIQKAKSYLRFKCLLGGFIFGFIIEVLAIEKMLLELYQKDVGRLEEQDDASSAAAPAAATDDTTSSSTAPVTNSSTSTSSSEQEDEAMLYATQRIQSFFSGLFWYESSYFYIDVMFVLYLAMVVKSRLFKNPSSSRGRGGPDFAPVTKASNWIVGMVIGMLVSLAAIFGPQVICQKLPVWLLTIAMGILAGILAREAIFQLFEVFAACWMNEEEDDEEGAADNIEQSSKEEGGDAFYVAHVV